MNESGTVGVERGEGCWRRGDRCRYGGVAETFLAYTDTRAYPNLQRPPWPRLPRTKATTCGDRLTIH